MPALQRAFARDLRLTHRDAFVGTTPTQEHTMDCRSTLVSTSTELENIRQLWSAWAGSPLQRPEWLLSWWKAFQSPLSKLAVLVVRDAEQTPIGLAPFTVRDHWLLGRQIRFLGSGRVCTDFQSFLAAPGRDAEVADSLADCLVQLPQLIGGVAEFEGVSASDAHMPLLLQRLQQRGYLLQTTELESTWRLDLSAGWAGVLESMSRTQRRQTRNIVNRFDKNPELQLVFADMISPSDRPRIDQFMDLHQRRWNAVQQPGCFSDARFRRFIHLVCEAMGPGNMLRLATLEESGVPIASHFYLQDAAGNRYMYQSGREPTSQVANIGRMLNAITVRAACEERVEFIDYLRGNEIYKQRLGALPTACRRIRAVPPAAGPRVRHSLWTMGRELKQGAQALRNGLVRSRTNLAEAAD